MTEGGANSPSSSDELKTAFAPGNVIVGNYEVLAHAGAGGMGVVYRARDLKLGRTVALKFLPPQVNASEKVKERFLKEARIASSLDHPNIGAIYGIDSTADGRTFIVMAFYEGPSLADRLARSGAMTPLDATDIAIQLARGLGEAHRRDIVHRDIKPSNVMFSGAGQVKIVDFGLARIAEQTATATHGTEGTVGYMAPEQALNQSPDQRSDIWALGVVLAEMLTGRNPFQRDSWGSVMLAILNDPPASLEGVPFELQRIIYKALSKDRDKRYQHCSEVLRDLEEARAGLAPGEAVPGSRSQSSADFRRSVQAASQSALIPGHAAYRKSGAWALAGIAAAVLLALALLFLPAIRRSLSSGAASNRAPTPSPDREILAVLPLQAAPNDPQLTALGNGLIESVAAKLAGFSDNRQLEIIPARNLRDKHLQSLSDARRQFGANLGFSLSLEKTGSLIKAAYSLLNAQTGAALAGNSISVPADGVILIEDAIVQDTVKALRLKLRPEEQATLAIHASAIPSAYTHYLQARGYLADYTKLDNIANAILMYREALKLDPNFGLAKASLGEAYWRKYVLTKDKRLPEEARSECEAAVTLGNAGAAGHICLGLVDSGTGQYSEAAMEYRRAVELEPANESAGVGLASALEHQGLVNEAEAAYQKVGESHPQSFFAANALGGFYYRRSEYDKAVQMYQKVTELAPENYAGFVNLGGTYNDLGRSLEAIEPLKKSIALRPSYQGYTNLGTSYMWLHKLPEAAAAYQQAVTLDPKQYVAWANLAVAQYYGGNKQEGLASYRKAADLAAEDLKVNPRSIDVLSDIAQYYAMIGERQKALDALGRALQYGHSEKELLASAAQVYNQLGETGLALEWITKAIQAGYSAKKFQDLPAFQNLVDNPRYQQIVGKAPPPH